MTEPRDHRRPDATREAILAAARDRFATEGYERASIAVIARDARVDPSTVEQYYATKADLFAAASEIVLRMPPVEHMPPENVGAALIHHFLERWENDELMHALLRVGVISDAGAERFQTIFRRQMAPVVAAVCPDPEQASTRAVLVTSQVLGMALARYVLKIPPAVAMTRGEMVAWLGPTVQRYLTADAP